MIQRSSASPILEILELLINNDEDGIKVVQIVNEIGCAAETVARNLKRLKSMKMAYSERKKGGTANYWRSYLHRESKE